MTNSWSSTGVPRTTSTYSVVKRRTGATPYTRPAAIASPASTASAIARQRHQRRHPRRAEQRREVGARSGRRARRRVALRCRRPQDSV